MGMRNPHKPAVHPLTHGLPWHDAQHHTTLSRTPGPVIMTFISRSRRAVLGLAPAALLLAAMPSAQAADAANQTLLNATYDVGRELFSEINPLFVAKWQKEHGGQLKIDQSYGGTSRQAQDIIQVKSFRSKLLEPGVGYIRISQFQEHTVNNLVNHLEQLAKQNNGPLKCLSILLPPCLANFFYF